MSTSALDTVTTAINTIRTLSMDGVQAANSGHPGTPMALAPVAYQIWAQEMDYDPGAPLWPNRDRYILSCGHASMLLYSMIHVSGIKKAKACGKVLDEPALTVDDLKNFRQYGSLTPGHPEHGHTTGVETTTGPLGQGCANSVGMAIGQNWLAARYNKPGKELFDFDVYVQCSDGDLMEGVACEAASLAGHLKLSNLCWVYDDNHITIEGDTDLAFSEDVATRFEGLGWTVYRVDDANDLKALGQAFSKFKANQAGPTLIIVRSVIGYGAPHAAGTSGAHGSPLGDEEVKLTKEAYGWPADKKFYVPDETLEHFASTMGERGAAARTSWDKTYEAYSAAHPELAAELDKIWAGELPAGWDKDLPVFPADPKGTATRGSGGKALNGVAKNLPWMLGGSADLAPSTKTLIDGEGSFGPTSHAGRNLHFGIREHAMAAAGNGMALLGLRPYVSTFFVFSDYLRPAMRLSALMKLPVTYVFTHDSIGVGEDGPTHQPVEQLAAARAIPGLVVMRPGDANEASRTWHVAIAEQHRPVAMVLTRQNMPTLCRDKYAAVEGVDKGAYVLADAEGGNPDVILMASGSELSLAVEAYEQLTADGVKARVVSVPSFELFEDQDASYRESVLPPAVTARVACEAGVRQGWDAYLGLTGAFIGMDSFGDSGPFEDVYKARGITAEAMVAAAKAQL
ncbi:Transketolase [Posidoniimonas polymericola]|uniref:Transketolase n=1 Tax=Posidoniimonas polymericola TaxID=2528002 RepID=A0A5C5YLP0_9BACT|nr:transketolase [Posidoniimonas polymericola]TWT75873.1 Transketolase [Posidoniimonas polymericola]